MMYRTAAHPISPAAEERPRSRAAGGTRRAITWALAAVILVGGLVVALDRGGTGPASGERFTPPSANSTAAETPPPSAASTLRVATFNIHGCRGPDRVCDVSRTAGCLPRLSLAGLNEVHHELWAPCQATQLGDALGMNWLFAPTERHHLREGFGNAVLSRLPVRAWRRIPLVNTRGKAFRNLVEVECDWNGQTLWFLVTHLDRRDDRLPQLRFVAERFLNTPAPAILLGDFNTRGDEAELGALLSAPGVHDLVAEGLATRAAAQVAADAPPSEIEVATLKQPLARIDWILGRGLRGTRAGVVERGASDHPAYWAEVERIAPLADESPADGSRAAKANHNKRATAPR